MAKFRFSMVVDGIERVKEVEISDRMLCPPHIYSQRYTDPYVLWPYRKNVIEMQLQKWALSHIKLDWEEIFDESQPSGTDQSNAQDQQRPPADA